MDQSHIVLGTIASLSLVNKKVNKSIFCLFHLQISIKSVRWKAAALPHTSPAAAAAAYKQNDLVFEVLNGAAGHAAKYIHMHLQIIHIGKSLENVLDSFENVTDIYFSF